MGNYTELPSITDPIITHGGVIYKAENQKQKQIFLHYEVQEEMILDLKFEIHKTCEFLWDSFINHF